MANCKQCGTALPAASFGELSDYCSSCRPIQSPPSRHGLVSELPRLAAGSVRWPAATVLLIATSIAVFIAMLVTGVSAIDPTSDQLLRWGANYGPYTLTGQYWRLISSAFLHVGLVHLIVNMVSLWILGRMVEKLFGISITCGLYLLTAVGAGLLTLSWDPMRLSAGASGAIFGLDGVLIPVLYYGKLGLDPVYTGRALGWVVKIALLNLLYGLRGNIDNMAHLGGLVTGLLAGIFLARSFSQQPQERLSAQIRVLAVTALLLLIILVPVKKAKAYAVELWQGGQATARKDWNSAIGHYQKSVSLNPDNSEGHSWLGSAYQAVGRLDDAAREYQRALALQPDQPWMEVNLADIYAYQGKSAEAVALYRRSISEVEPDATEYWRYGGALYSLQKYEEAENALQRSLALDNSNAEVHDLMADVYDKLGKSKEARNERRRVLELSNKK